MTEARLPMINGDMQEIRVEKGLALRFDEVEFSYREAAVLRRFSAELLPGRLTCIIGKNGSGKSTLIGVADGLLRPSAGRVVVGGAEVAALSSMERARRIGVLFQQNGLPAATVEELVSRGRFPHARATRLSEEDFAVIDAAIARLGLEDIRSRLVAELSGGQRQRAFLAMVLAQDTPVLLLDEPTAALDAHASHEIMELARGLARSGKTVGVVIHDLDLALRYADELIVVDEGLPVASGLREAILADAVIRKVFGMRTVPAADPVSGEEGLALFPE